MSNWRDALPKWRMIGALLSSFKWLDVKYVIHVWKSNFQAVQKHYLPTPKIQQSFDLMLLNVLSSFKVELIWAV